MAEAEANAAISASLTDEFIAYEKVQKWNGSVPKVQGSGAAIISIDDNEGN